MCRICGRVVKCIFDSMPSRVKIHRVPSRSIYYDQTATGTANFKFLQNHTHSRLNILDHPCIQQSFTSHTQCFDSEINYIVLISTVVVFVTATVADVESFIPIFLHDTHPPRLSKENGHV
ncbi:putative WD repeat-containing protein [Fonsecaea multimorphosa]|nr:putative WD repeat-containing protein [Fonsecaea multimorphosa]